MSVASFKPVVWSALLLTALKKNLVGENFINHNYEGEVVGAGSVKINSIGAIQVGTYDGTPITYEDLSTTDQTLLIDRQKYWAFQVDDVDKAQVCNSSELMTRAMSEAAYALANDADTNTFKTLVAGAGGKINTVTSNVVQVIPVTTSDAAKNVLLELNRVADEKNIPSDGRVVAVTPAFKAKLLADKYLGLNPAVGADLVRAGYIGELYGLRLFVTNNIETKTSDASYSENCTFAILAHPMGTTEAAQVDKVEALRSGDSFKDLVRGLYVSGIKVTMPDTIVTAAITFNPVNP